MSDRFDAMQAFAAVCDGQGFAAAARRLHVSPSVVTRLVAGLERRLGVRLLQRTTRSVRLTEAGARFLEQARRILADLEEAERSAPDGQAAPRGRVVVAAPLLFGRMHVAPVVSRLLQAHPQVGAELLLSDRFCNMVEDGVDVAVRIGALAPSGLVARRLGQTRRLLAASPGYLEAHGVPQAPADLPGHQLVAFRPMMAGREWAFHQPGGGLLSVVVEPRFTTDSADAALGHAAAGGGITAAFCYQAGPLLRSGALVEVLPGFAPPPSPIHAVFPSAQLLPGAVRAFLGLLAEAAPGWRFGG